MCVCVCVLNVELLQPCFLPWLGRSKSFLKLICRQPSCFRSSIVSDCFVLLCNLECSGSFQRANIPQHRRFWLVACKYENIWNGLCVQTKASRLKHRNKTTQNTTIYHSDCLFSLPNFVRIFFLFTSHLGNPRPTGHMGPAATFLYPAPNLGSSFKNVWLRRNIHCRITKPGLIT